MTEFKESIARRKQPAGTAAPVRNYTIPDGASIPSEFISNPDDKLLKESFFMNNSGPPPDPFGQQFNSTGFSPGQFPPDFPVAPQNRMPPYQEHIDYANRMQQMRIQERTDNITRKLDLLLKSTILKKEIPITDELVFVIRNLTNEQQAAALLNAIDAKFKIEESLIIRNWLVAQSIDRVSGMSIGDIFGTDSIENRLFLINKLDDKVTARLHQEVLAFQEECEKKYGVRTQADFDQLIAEIKKA